MILYLTRQKVELFDGKIVPLFGGMFGIFGHGNLSGIGEALWAFRESMPFYRGQNEQGIGHAACAFAKANRNQRVMGVTSSIGPGATNMVTSAALAKINRLPVLFLPGDIFVNRRPDPVLQQLENENCPLTSVNDCFIPVSSYFDRVSTPEQLLQTLPQAIETLVNPAKRGPVTLAMPQDVQTKCYDYPESFFDEKIHYVVRPRPCVREVERAAKLLKKSKRPFMIIGGGVLYSGAEKDLSEFSKKHQIPFGETQAGKGAIPWDHPLNLGGIGVTGTKAANIIAYDADLILSIGTRLSDFTTASKSLFHKSDVNNISINLSSMDCLKVKGEKIVADIKVGLEALSNAIDDFKTDYDYLNEINNALDEWEVIFQNATKPLQNLSTLTEPQVIHVLNQTLNDDDIIVAAAGGLPGELHKLWRTKRPLGYHLEYGYSCMGYEIAGGLGVKMARPDREVYVMVGDGSYLMLHTELLTANQLGIKINIILFDNKGFGCINRLQKACGQKPFGNLFEKSGPLVDFVANARSLGCQADKARSLDELKEILQKNRSINRSCVTVIETDPESSTNYGQWWDVAIAEKSNEEGVGQALFNYEEKLKTIYPNI